MNNLPIKILLTRGYLIIILVCLGTAGCAGTIMTKHFKVIADPPDARIKVISGIALREQKFTSPAAVAAEVPMEPTLAAKTVLEVAQDNYKTAIVPLRQIEDGATIKIKLEKIDACLPGFKVSGKPLNKIAYRIKYRLLAPVPLEKINHSLGNHTLAPTQSEEIRFEDQTILAYFSVDEQSFLMNLTNRSPHPLKIRWYQADYTDIRVRRSRLMHSGIRYQDRNNPIPDQIVASGSSIQEAITPIEHVYVSKTGAYEIMPLFNRVGDGGAGLKGKVFNLFIPIEINRTIIPYNFRIEITDVVVVTAKD